MPDQREQLRGVLHQALARSCHLGIVFEVVVAIGQRQTALVNVGDDVVGAVQVGRRIKIEQRIGPKHLHPGDSFDQPDLVFRVRDALEFRLQRFYPVGIRGALVNARAVVVADFLGDGIASRTAGGSFLQNLAHDSGISFSNLDKASPGRLVGGNFRGLQPVAAGVLVEIDAGIDGLVDGVEIDGWLGLGETGNRQEQKNCQQRAK